MKRFQFRTPARAGAVVIAVALVSWAGSRGARAEPDAHAQARGRCVVRWNQMRMDWQGTVVAVRSRPRCEVELAFAYLQPRGSCAPAALYRIGPRTCLDRTNSFVCQINSYGAYACPSHASRTRVREWNAVLRADKRLVLNNPPAITPHVALPAWARRYPYRDGLIHPWTASGELRQGLKLTGHYRGTCSRTSAVTRTKTALRCGVQRAGFLYLLDPCFARSASWRRGGVVGACETAPGSLTFQRLLITGAVGP